LVSAATTRRWFCGHSKGECEFKIFLLTPFSCLATALELAEFATLAVLPLGAGGLALGTAVLAAETALTEVLLGNLNDILASPSTIEFWSV
jgi:hypothetical protein